MAFLKLRYPTRIALALAVASAPVLTASATAGPVVQAPTIDVEGPAKRIAMSPQGELEISWGMADDVDIAGYRTTLHMSPYNSEDAHDRLEFEKTYPEGDRPMTIDVSQTIPVPQGWTGCLEIAAWDTEGNTNYTMPEMQPGVSPTPCFAAPIDDLQLDTFSGGWRHATGPGNFMKTISSTKKNGQAFRLEDSHWTDVWLMVTKGPGYGKLRIFRPVSDPLNVSLQANNVKKRALIKIPMSEADIDAQPDGFLASVTSDDKPVKIDGIVALETRYPSIVMP